MSKFFLVLFFAGSVAFQAHAQSKAGYRALHKQDFESALEAFMDGVWDPVDKPASLLGIAQLYADSNFFRYSLDSAYLYAEKAQLAYSDLAFDQKDKARKRFNTAEVNRLKKEVEQLSFAVAIQEHTLPSYNAFLEKYPRAAYRLRNTVEKRRNELAYAQAQQEGSWQSFQTLLDRYGPSLKQKSPDLYRQAQTTHFRGYIGDFSWSGYPGFAERYPDNLFVQDSLTKFAFDKVRKTNDFSTYRQFYSTHPESPYAGFVRDSLFSLATRYGDLKDFNYLVNQFPGVKPSPAFWATYYERYKLENNTEEGLLAFREKYPQFPFADQLEADLAPFRRKAEEQQYQQLLTSVELTDFYAFLQEHPRSTYTPQVEAWTLDRLLDLHMWQHYADFLERFPENRHRQKVLLAYYERLLEEDNPELLRPFAQQFPDFNQRQRLDEDVKWLEKAIALGWTTYKPEKKEDFSAFIQAAAPREIAFKALWQMVKSDIRQQRWGEAMETVALFQGDFGSENMHFNQLRELLSAPAQEVEVRSLSDQINTGGQEYEPVISADGKTLFFTGRNRKDNMGGEDIFVSRLEQGAWTEAKLVSDLSTALSHESAEALSVDGNSMILFQSGKICYSEKTSQGWSSPTPFPPIVNRFSWQADARLSADGKALLFAARKPNDDVDIYVSLQQGDGSWGVPINLGRTINTLGTDRSPFLHPDLKTLYFSSTGHVGVGKMDVFKTTRLDDTWTRWSEPVNIGRYINTAEHDWGYRISTEGQTAYFSFSQGENQDIGVVDLPQAARPGEVSTLSGRVIDRSGAPLDAVLVWRDLETNELLQTVRSDPASGAFFVTFPRLSRFGYSAKKQGYFPENGNIDLTGGRRDTTLDVVLASLDEMREGQLALPINNLFFESGKYEIQPASFADLDLLADLLLENDFTVEILGYTDNVGDPQVNLALSQNRANATRTYLISKGCDPHKILTRGLGEKDPVQSNLSESGRALNRRVEIRVVR